jgi:hypothetical protein
LAMLRGRHTSERWREKRLALHHREPDHLQPRRPRRSLGQKCRSSWSRILPTKMRRWQGWNDGRQNMSRPPGILRWTMCWSTACEVGLRPGPEFGLTCEMFPKSCGRHRRHRIPMTIRPADTAPGERRRRTPEARQTTYRPLEKIAISSCGGTISSWA